MKFTDLIVMYDGSTMLGGRRLPMMPRAAAEKIVLDELHDEGFTEFRIYKLSTTCTKILANNRSGDHMEAPIQYK